MKTIKRQGNYTVRTCFFCGKPRLSNSLYDLFSAISWLSKNRERWALTGQIATFINKNIVTVGNQLRQLAYMNLIQRRNGLVLHRGKVDARNRFTKDNLPT